MDSVISVMVFFYQIIPTYWECFIICKTMMKTLG